MRILLADDSSVIRHLLEATLSASGHEVLALADGAGAWEAFERAPAPLVILDWQMPLLDGLEVCRRIRASPAGRDTFVLIVTGREAEEDLVSALDAGADDYLTKPVSPVQLRARVTIAERRLQLSRARWAAEDALARAQWLAGIGEVTLTINHEINNPLMALLANAQLLLMDQGLTAETREQVDAIQEQARRIGAVVERLRALKNPRAVEYLAGQRMIDLVARGDA